MNCQHDLAERETACADGYCPICQAIDLRNLRAERDALKDTIFHLESWIDHHARRVTEPESTREAEIVRRALSYAKGCAIDAARERT